MADQPRAGNQQIGESVILRPYDENGRCEKCGHDDIATSHHAHEERQSRYGCALVEVVETSFPPEHLCRRCKRCSFSWPEAILGQGSYADA